MICFAEGGGEDFSHPHSIGQALVVGIFKCLSAHISQKRTSVDILSPSFRRLGRLLHQIGANVGTWTSHLLACCNNSYGTSRQLEIAQNEIKWMSECMVDDFEFRGRSTPSIKWNNKYGLTSWFLFEPSSQVQHWCWWFLRPRVFQSCILFPVLIFVSMSDLSWFVLLMSKSLFRIGDILGTVFAHFKVSMCVKMDKSWSIVGFVSAKCCSHIAKNWMRCSFPLLDGFFYFGTCHVIWASVL